MEPFAEQPARDDARGGDENETRRSRVGVGAFDDVAWRRRGDRRRSGSDGRLAGRPQQQQDGGTVPHGRRRQRRAHHRAGGGRLHVELRRGHELPARRGMPAHRLGDRGNLHLHHHGSRRRARAARSPTTAELEFDVCHRRRRHRLLEVRSPRRVSAVPGRSTVPRRQRGFHGRRRHPTARRSQGGDHATARTEWRSSRAPAAASARPRRGPWHATGPPSGSTTSRAKRRPARS